MHHVLIAHCSLKSIYFAEIAFICDVGAIKLTDIGRVNPHNYSGFRWSGGEQLCPCQMSILILLACHDKVRIEKGLLTEPVVFIIGHYIHYKTMSFLFNSVLYFSHNYHMVKEEKRGIGVI